MPDLPRYPDESELRDARHQGRNTPVSAWRTVRFPCNRKSNWRCDEGNRVVPNWETKVARTRVLAKECRPLGGTRVRRSRFPSVSEAVTEHRIPTDSSEDFPRCFVRFVRRQGYPSAVVGPARLWARAIRKPPPPSTCSMLQVVGRRRQADFRLQRTNPNSCIASRCTNASITRHREMILRD